MYNKLVKCLFPRRCFVCGIRGGWGKNNIDTIKIVDMILDDSYDYHHHKYCLLDAICKPHDYPQKVVEKAVKAHTLRKSIEKRMQEEHETFLFGLKQKQQEVCKDMQ